ncbi:MAG: NAD-dependent epimerase/dehydratase family protein [Candidatus Binatia bacterium]
MKKRAALDRVAGHRRHASLRAQVAEPAALPGPRVGMVEYFRRDDRDGVESVLADLRGMGVTDLRTIISWAEWDSPEGSAWYDWLLPRLASEVNLIPCVLYTSLAQGVVPRVSAPPWDPKSYGDFIDILITRFGACFDWVELWNEPDRLTEWDRTLDPHWQTFCAMIGGAAYWAQRRGKRTVLAGLSVFDPTWLELMFRRGVMQYIDAVGIHGFPGVSEVTWEGWPALIHNVQQSLDHHRSGAEIWITSTGYSTWRHDEYEQLRMFVEAIETPVERVYWYCARDLDPEFPTREGFHADDRDYHFGLRRSDGTPKLLGRLWSEGGLEAVRGALDTQTGTRRSWTRPARPVLITGGAGFVGTNLAHRLLEQGERVLVLDNLSRPGVERNLRWLLDTHGERVQVEFADVRNPYALRRAVRNASHVFHFAAQVAVTTSLANPRHDFDVNALGTLNLLEALRAADEPPPLLFTSTNKVYGGLEDIALTSEGGIYYPKDIDVRANGIDELRPLDLHSPYGCSKGAADQYIIDYARTFGLPAVVFRMSCIYGPHQMGNEDQGWVAHFLIRALEGQTITLYGDGQQVRDVLYVDDLVDAFLLARAEMPRIAGQAFNIGGGPEQAISLLELIDMIGRLHGHRPQYEFQDWRAGDQRYYVSDTRKFRNATGWSPKVRPYAGTKKLYRWLRDFGGLGQSRSEPVRPRQPVVYRRATSRNGVAAAERH